MNTGAKMGNFAHDTGEGGISRYHRGGGGDLIWQIGTGYFGCRNEQTAASIPTCSRRTPPIRRSR